MATKKAYGSKASSKVKSAMEKMKDGKLTSGRSNKKVTNKKQAIAIGLSEAKKEGGKVPAKATGRKVGAKKTASRFARKPSVRSKSGSSPASSTTSSKGKKSSSKGTGRSKSASR